jgi:probable F420-dependent oxidoreductase
VKIGVVFPQYEAGMGVGEIKVYAQAVEAMGYEYILVSDHVLGVKLTADQDWDGAEDLKPVFRDPFVLCSYMAGATSKLGFSTAVMILPQRQTALVAKQAADLDVLCNGRFRLGVGSGWNKVEYEALGVNFADRGKILDDQIEVLRALWTKPAVTIRTSFHTITDAGLNPLPVQRPIPLWFGGGDPNLPNTEKLVRRIARVGDGWIPHLQPNDAGREQVAKLHGYCREYGRDPAKLGLEGFLNAARKTESMWGDHVRSWLDLGATHLAVSTTEDSLKGADQHLRRLEEVRKILPK